MENIDKYIGIPHVFAGYAFSGADCVGLVRLFYSEHHWEPSCYDGSFEKDWWKTQPLRMVRYLMENFDMTRNIDDLHFGDLCYFCINGEGHVGIFTQYGKMLTTFPEGTQWDGSVLPSKSMIVHRTLWQQGFRAGFKRRN